MNAALVPVRQARIIQWRENPLFGQPMTEAAFLAAGHVAVEIGRLRPISFAEKFLRGRVANA